MENMKKKKRNCLVGVGIDTSRYGHVVKFMSSDLSVAAPGLIVTECRDGYDKLEKQLNKLSRSNPGTYFKIRIDAAGQYSANLENFLRGLPLPIDVSVGEPTRNKNYRQAHYPKTKTDDVEGWAMARFSVIEQPPATPKLPDEFFALCEITSRLQGAVKDSTRAINRLHNLLSRVFPELENIVSNVAAGWVLALLQKYPSSAKIARARLKTLKSIPYAKLDKVKAIHEEAKRSVGALHGPLIESMLQELVGQVQSSKKVEKRYENLLIEAYRQLPDSGHKQVETIIGIGEITAAILVSKIISIDRFEMPKNLVGYFGVFPNLKSSGINADGTPKPAPIGHMSCKGNDLVRRYLWTAAFSAIQHNPAIRALFNRLRKRGTRGDVAVGHCMRKLLHLVFAVWKTDKPFDKNHYPWETKSNAVETTIEQSTRKENAVGPKMDTNSKEVASQEVTTATVNLDRQLPSVKQQSAKTQVAKSTNSVDYAYLRSQVTIEQVLKHIDHFENLRGTKTQRRGPCPIHKSTSKTSKSFSVNLTKNVFQCFNQKCGAHGNTLDFWAAIHGQTIHQAAIDIAKTFGLSISRNREEEPVI